MYMAFFLILFKVLFRGGSFIGSKGQNIKRLEKEIGKKNQITLIFRFEEGRYGICPFLFE